MAIFSYIGRVFWSREQKRLRLVWRLAGFAVLYLIVSTLLGLLQVIIMSAMGKSLSPGEMLSPAGPEGFRLVGPMLMTLVTLGAMYFASLILDRRKFSDFGFRINWRWWQDLGFGLFLGAAIMLVIFLVEWSLGWITVLPAWSEPSLSLGIWQALSQGLLVFIFVGIYEEALSRGYLLRNIAEGMNARWWKPETAVIVAALITSGLFGFAHAFNPNATILSSILISVAGIMLAAGYVLTGQLAIPIGIHITWNFFQGYVFGFPVSGMGSGRSIFVITQGGPDLWTGGEFGPEAGIVGLLAMLTLMFAVWLYARAKGQGRLDANLAVPSLRWDRGEVDEVTQSQDPNEFQV